MGKKHKNSAQKEKSPDTADEGTPNEQGLAAIKEWYYLSLFVCFAGVLGFYTGYAYLQEELLADKSKKLNTSLVLGFQNLIAVLISTAIIKVFGMGALMDEFHKGDAVVGTLNFCTMYCSNFALKFVSYPFVVLAKSAKILPVCLTGWIIGVYKLTWTQTALFITISSGLVIFNFNKVKGSHVEDESIVGLLLVLASLLFDGFVNAETDKNHRA